MSRKSSSSIPHFTSDRLLCMSIKRIPHPRFNMVFPILRKPLLLDLHLLVAIAKCCMLVLMAFSVFCCSTGRKDKQTVLVTGFVLSTDMLEPVEAIVAIHTTIIRTDLTDNNQGFAETTGRIGLANTDQHGFFHLEMETHPGLQQIRVEGSGIIPHIGTIILDDRDSVHLNTILVTLDTTGHEKTEAIELHIDVE